MGYEKVSYWKNENTGAYKAALTYGWLEDIKRELFKNPTLTDEYCIEDAIKYKSTSEWKKKSPRVYGYAMRKKWLGKCRTAMFEIHGDEFNGGAKPSGYWTKERCMEDAKNHNSKYQWRKANSSAYGIALKKKWLDECCAHMTQLQDQKPAGYWTKERCMESASKHDNRNEWYRANSGAVAAARKNEWYDECVAHMKSSSQNPSGYWNDKEKCMEEARKYNRRSHWLKGSGASYNSAYRNGWMDECCEHMLKNVKVHKEDEAEFLTRIANKYTSRKEWYEADPKNYIKCFNLGLMDELTGHMDDYVNFTINIFNNLIDILEDTTNLGTNGYLTDLNKNSKTLKDFCFEFRKEVKT